MKKIVIACLSILVSLASLAIAQEAPFKGDVRPISISPGEDLLSAMSKQATSLLNNPDIKYVWVGYPLRVREAFRNSYKREFGSGRYHNVTIINDIVIEWDNEGIERVGSDVKAVLFHFTKTGGQVLQDRISFLNMDNSYRFVTPLLWIGNVSSDRSLAAVTRILNSAGQKHLHDDAAFVLAMHEGREPLRTMQGIILSDKSVDLREDVLFWFGLALAPSEQNLLFALEGRLDHPDLREKLAFIYSRLDTEETLKKLISMARNDRDHDVREKAIFWMGQKANARLAAELGDIIDNDPDTDIKKRAVFALSRMETPESRNALMRLARSSRNPEVRKAAIFWLSRDDDEQVVDFLEEILIKQ